MTAGRESRWALLAVSVLLTATPTTALATGLELAWNHCYGQAGAQSMRTSACATNSGSQTMIVSFRPPAGITKLEGIEVYIDYQVAGGSLSCWWNFSAGQLRHTQLTPLPVSPTDVNGNPLIVCDNYYFQNHAATGGGWMTVSGADRGHLRGVVTIPAGAGGPVPPDAQEYGLGFRIANGLTVPGAGCTGCSQAVCFELRAVRLYSAGLPDEVLRYPHPGSENYVTWQGTPASTGCPGTEWQPIPVLQSTWGAIKSIYR